MGMDDMRLLHALDREAVRLRYGQIWQGFLYFSLILVAAAVLSSASGRESVLLPIFARIANFLCRYIVFVDRAGIGRSE